CDRQVVTDRAEACREGVGLRLADVGLGVVLSDEESADDDAGVADGDGGGTGAGEERGEPGCQAGAAPDMNGLGLVTIDGAAMVTAGFSLSPYGDHFA